MGFSHEAVPKRTVSSLGFNAVFTAPLGELVEVVEVHQFSLRK
jgi:hypothetical protein